MKGVILVALLSMFLTGILAMPLCSENSETGDCKNHGSFFEVDCAEKLKFKHAKATCFMNDKDDFIILAVDDRKLSKRSIVADEKTLLNSNGGKVLVRRLKRSLDNEQDFKAEVLSSTDLKELLNKHKDMATESPLHTNEVAPGAGTITTDTESDVGPFMGLIIIVTGAEGANTEVSDSNETSLSANGEDDLAEALFGLMLLGAIMEEVKKHQIENLEQE